MCSISNYLFLLLLVTPLWCQPTDQPTAKESTTTGSPPQQVAHQSHLTPQAQALTKPTSTSLLLIPPTDDQEPYSQIQNLLPLIKSLQKEITQYKQQETLQSSTIKLIDPSIKENTFNPSDSSLLSTPSNKRNTKDKSMNTDKPTKDKPTNIDKPLTSDTQTKVNPTTPTTKTTTPLPIVSKNKSKPQEKSTITKEKSTTTPIEATSQETIQPALETEQDASTQTTAVSRLQDKILKVLGGDFTDLLFVVCFGVVLSLAVVGLCYLVRRLLRTYPTKTSFEETSFRCPEYEESPQSSNEYR